MLAANRSWRAPRDSRSRVDAGDLAAAGAMMERGWAVGVGRWLAVVGILYMFSDSLRVVYVKSLFINRNFFGGIVA